jgi:hypothetical protein
VALLLQATVPMLVRAARSRPPQPDPVEEPALVS